MATPQLSSTDLVGIVTAILTTAQKSYVAGKAYNSDPMVQVQKSAMADFINLVSCNKSIVMAAMDTAFMMSSFRISIYEMEALNRTIVQKMLPTLVSLDLEEAHDFTDPRSLPDLPSLKRLVCNVDYSVDTETPGLWNSFPNLEELVVPEWMPNPNLAAIHQLARFKDLKLKMWFETTHLLGELFNLTNLTKLGLNITDMEDGILPTTIGNLTQLTELELICETMDAIPNVIGKLTSLREISIYLGYRLTHLPHSIGKLTNLTILSLNDCLSLETLPKTIGKLSRLNQLDFMSCINLTHLPRSIGNLSSLKELDLQCCYRLESLPKSIGKLISLNNLNLSYCRSLTKLPASFGDLTNLTQLYLWNNVETPMRLHLSKARVDKLLASLSKLDMKSKEGLRARQKV